MTSIWNNFSPNDIFKLVRKPVDVSGIGKRVFGTVDESDWKSDLVQGKNWCNSAVEEARFVFSHVYEVPFFVEKTEMDETLN